MCIVHCCIAGSAQHNEWFGTARCGALFATGRVGDAGRNAVHQHTCLNNVPHRSYLCCGMRQLQPDCLRCPCMGCEVYRVGMTDGMEYCVPMRWCFLLGT